QGQCLHECPTSSRQARDLFESNGRLPGPNEVVLKEGEMAQANADQVPLAIRELVLKTRCPPEPIESMSLDGPLRRLRLPLQQIEAHTQCRQEAFEHARNPLRRSGFREQRFGLIEMPGVQMDHGRDL